MLRRAGREATPLLLQLRRCDRGATGREPPPGAEEKRERFEALVREQWDAPVTRGELALDGTDLLRLGYEAGPGLGAALDTLLDAVVEDPSRNTRTTLERLAVERLRAEEEPCSSAST